MEWPVIWAFVKKFWYVVPLAVLSLLCLHLSNKAESWHSKAALCEQTRKTDRANFEKAAAESSAKNRATVLAAERKWQEVVSEKDKQYNEAIVSANASVSNYVARMREQTAAYRNNLEGAGISATPFPATGIDGTSEATLVPVSDLNICAENTKKAETWQSFWLGLVAGQPSTVNNSGEDNR